MAKCHYDTLGISKDATTTEIKKAFRKLSMETHPDVSNNPSCSEKFKHISEAYRVLSNTREKGAYDFNVQETERWGRPTGGGSNSRTSGRPGGVGSSSSTAREYYQFVDSAYRPRNILTGVALGACAVAAFSFLSATKDTPEVNTSSAGKNLVEAWKNPKTNQWEQPAPWDATYRQLKPELQLVSRDQVMERQLK